MTTSPQCPSCGTPMSVTTVLNPITGKAIRRTVHPCRRCP